MNVTLHAVICVRLFVCAVLVSPVLVGGVGSADETTPAAAETEETEIPVEAESGSVQRLLEVVRLELAEDAFIVVEVLGKGSLYPVVQERSWSGLQADATTPYALTNPVFVDVDGNGRFDPPLPRKIRLLPAQ